jgi:dienelactone hydrolase
VSPEVQARDAFDGAAYLRAALRVRARRIGVIGFSHGGWAVLTALLAGLVRHANEPPFVAAVAFYPGCDAREPPGRSLETDTLISLGNSDDWTPMARCVTWRDALQTDRHVLQMNIYAGAWHGLDAPRALRFYAGHDVGQDPAALADSPTKTRRFFDQRLLAQH